MMPAAARLDTMTAPMADAADSFRSAMIADGLTPPATVVSDGRLHRCPTSDRRGDDAGWYVLHTDGIPGGEYGDWRTGLRKTWRAEIGRRLTPAEEAAHRKRLDASRWNAEQERRRAQAAAARTASALWRAAQPAGADNPYLLRKRVQPVATLRELPVARVAELIGYRPQAHGEPLTGRILIAPVRIGDSISTMEMIDEDGHKSALAGGTKAGGYWAAQRLPEGDGDGLTLLIGEGVATVLSTTEATGHPALAALSAGNLPAVAQTMRTRYPAAALVILADVLKTTGDADPHAIEAARAVAGLLAVPTWIGDRPEGMTDMNDLTVSEGNGAVVRCIQVAQTVAAVTVNDWPDMQPLPATDELFVPPLDLELVPAGLRDWLADASDRLQVPPEMIATPAVVSMAALVGRTVGIYPKRHDDWLVVPNLWGLLVGRPGTMKSPAVREGTRFLRRLAATASADYARVEVEESINRAAIAAETIALKRAAEKPGADLEAFKVRFAELQEELAASTPTERRYMTQDATVEKIGEILLANPSGILMLRDELSGWLRMLDRPGREGDREFFLEAWNGDSDYTVDRIGRGTLHIPALCLSVFGTMQPGKLRGYLSAAAEGGAGDDGLVQRFQMAVWPDVTGDWRNVDRWPDSPARERAARVFGELNMLTAESLGAVADGDGIPALRFKAEAQELFDAWRAELEARLRSAGMMAVPSYEAHVAKYRSLMPSLALLWHAVDVVDGCASPGAVPLSSARIAAAWVEFMDGHARRLYAVESDPCRAAAGALADRIQSGDVQDGATLREISRPQWSGLRTAQLARAAAELLESLGWVRVESRDTGGRPSPVLRLHPRLRGDS